MSDYGHNCSCGCILFVTRVIHRRFNVDPHDEFQWRVWEDINNIMTIHTFAKSIEHAQEAYLDNDLRMFPG